VSVVFSLIVVGRSVASAEAVAASIQTNSTKMATQPLRHTNATAPALAAMNSSASVQEELRLGLPPMIGGIFAARQEKVHTDLFGA
jgi:hypothetical protein